MIYKTIFIFTLTRSGVFLINDLVKGSPGFFGSFYLPHISDCSKLMKDAHVRAFLRHKVNKNL